MPEAKDQGHTRKRSPKKKKEKVLQKFFLGDLQFISVPRILDRGRTQTTNHMK